MRPADCLQMSVDRSDEVKSTAVNVRIRWRSPAHLWLYCALMGLPPTAMTMPGHDLPVAWRQKGGYDLQVEVIVSPAMPRSRWGVVRDRDLADFEVLEAMPGRSPVRR